MIDSAELLKKKSRNVKKGLSGTEIDEYLAAMKGWSYEDNHIVKAYSFKNYHETLAFVNALAFVVNAENHHPDLLVSFNRCVVMFNTHSVGGVSENDFICAAKIDAMASHNYAPVAH
ncbi:MULTISPECIES: 4a-hydroxytetrahydrobiopterin dehydratase [unclassified Bdellovibrio]|uniref:4a-hydroxytetrahydrobiopterin dehydratase n=1 Tax=unclassified Bdellovibrio TaxID=2633795 RepID=UPI00115A22F2|nr:MULTISPECIES: 4a-hydroxytetrahydrobiopterin dehydratase [unclassified Bdellovibrio]QDK46543.1 4a-hydroxytetrahydrobiopterin dehydratase [Bdellovibrio sp. ZAP7]QLY24736.1 4a-hydroxytetrahydrobiopterin dehydratase [Bdellovibrio sp. KM01]